MGSLFFTRFDWMQEFDVLFVDLNIGVRFSTLRRKYANRPSLFGFNHVILGFGYIMPVLGWLLRTDSFEEELRSFAPNFNFQLGYDFLEIIGLPESVERVFFALVDLNTELGYMFGILQRESAGNIPPNDDPPGGGPAGGGHNRGGFAGGPHNRGGFVGVGQHGHDVGSLGGGWEPMEIDQGETMRDETACGGPDKDGKEAVALKVDTEDQDLNLKKVGGEDCCLCWNKHVTESCTENMKLNNEVYKEFSRIIKSKGDAVFLKENKTAKIGASTSRNKLIQYQEFIPLRPQEDAFSKHGPAELATDPEQALPTSDPNA